MNNRWILFLFFLLLFAVSCSKKPAPRPMWEFKKDAIILHYTTDPLLNIFEGSPHTLLVIIYEMSDSSSFSKFAQYPAGIRKLLNQEVDDPSILTYKRIFIEPGKKGKIVLDRVERAKWIGIVAGYYSLDPQKSVKIMQIPYKIEKVGFIFFKKKVAIIPKITVNLVFTKDSIQIERTLEEKQ
ncbi:MAG: type VI secretion system lipoprotein TssJ [Desulfonauticus sp.]|nr:type VI secretion system lipoprotein TssJ [Desulfonauticus sp.]